jgi:hypothetical protein
MPEVFTAPIAAAGRAQDEEATSTTDAERKFLMVAK